MTVENPSIRVRFAPSPTGYLHIGGARTALFNWLFARHMKGTFILRIEDTDEVRSTGESVNGILESMRWLDLDWDEGPVFDSATASSPPDKSIGSKGPYYQMQRLTHYQSSCSQLIEKGQAYPCYCTPEEVEKMRERAMLAKRPPKYDGTCRNLTADQRKAKEAEGRKTSVRFKTPTEGNTDFSDIVRGAMHFENNLLEDFVILKSSGVPTYNFACVVDDHLMEISHVIRGDDHLSNTPRQILVYQALGWKYPQFAHLAMILGSDGARLSKRHGATSVMDYKEGGYLPDALLNYLALLGWGTEDSQQLFTQADMIEKFALERCGKSPATFDPAKLLWMNGEYVRKAPVSKIAELAKRDFYPAAGLDQVSNAAFEGAIALEHEKMKLISEVPKLIDFLIFDEYEYRQEAVDKVLKTAGAGEILADMAKRLDALSPFDTPGIETTIKTCAKDRGIKNAPVIHSLRVAVSGRTEGPSLYHMVEYLGKTRTLQRIQKAQALIAAANV
jgi:nondiscriminating glutamyl-tRNA synthetase